MSGSVVQFSGKALEAEFSSFVEAHQGKITANNIKDDTSGNGDTIKGALFTVELPLSKAE